MNREELKNIFSDSACLTPKQMKHYVCGEMTNEESHAVEVHLNSCPFCNEAIEGLFEQKEGHATEMVTELNTNFLKNHFQLHNPQVHLNSIAPAQPVVHVQKRKKVRTQPLWRPSSIAAALLLGFALLWYFEFGQKMIRQKKLAQQIVAESAASQPQATTQQADVPAVQEDRAVPAPRQTDVQAPVQQAQAAMGGHENPQVPQPLIVTGKDALKQQDEAKKHVDKEESEEKNIEETVVTAYKAPLIDAYSDGKSTGNKNTETTRNTDISRVEVSAGKTARLTPASVAEDPVYASSAKEKDAVSADDLYEQKKYGAALNLYRKEMSTGGRGHRQRAAIMIARCYLAMGNKTSAKQVLQSVIDEGGSQKRVAKRMLSELEGDKSE